MRPGAITVVHKADVEPCALAQGIHAQQIVGFDRSWFRLKAIHESDVVVTSHPVQLYKSVNLMEFNAPDRHKGANSKLQCGRSQRVVIKRSRVKLASIGFDRLSYFERIRTENVGDKMDTMTFGFRANSTPG